MLHIRLITVGTLKETFWRDAYAEYAKRLTRYCKLELIEIKESNPKQESADIRAKLDTKKGHVFLMDIKGTPTSSEDLASKISNLSQTTSTITFIIGGSDGVYMGSDPTTQHGSLATLINDKISFGKITLPHQLFRVILTEQIYRAFTMIGNEKYHK